MIPSKFSPELLVLIERIKTIYSFSELDFSDINVRNSLGENALHVVTIWGELESAKLLLDDGIDINTFGDLGHTPLHEACSFGHIELVKLLIARGADLFARAEGDIPFTCARSSNHDAICDLLAKEMDKSRALDDHAYIKSRIAELRREIDWLEKSMQNQ